MSKILEAFAEDNLSNDPATYRGNSEYRKALKVKYNSAETLNEKLDDEEKNYLSSTAMRSQMKAVSTKWIDLSVDIK